jgi:uncharacterized protein
MATDVRVDDNRDQHRYEAHVGDQMAGFADYQLATDLIVLTHTEVDPAYEGQGIGGKLARAAMDDVSDRGLQALLICPFMSRWVDRHPDYHGVVYGAPPSKVTD